MNGVTQAVQGVEHCARLSRERCRLEFERRFTAERMMEDYLALYRDLAQAGSAAGAPERREPRRAAR